MRIEMAAALLMERIIRETYSEKRSSAIQPLQWSILRYISEAPIEKRDVASISRYVGLTPAPVSRAITTLEERGHIRRSEHPKSRRSVAVTITKQGIAVLENDPILRVVRGIESFPRKDCEVFVKSLRKLMLQDTMDLGSFGEDDSSS